MPVYSIKFSGILNKTKAFLNDCNDDSMHIALEIKNEGKIQTYIDLKPCVYHFIQQVWYLIINDQKLSEFSNYSHINTVKHVAHKIS